MPFVQMENISQFLKACQTPPLSLKEHDVFLTVDLYEGKDPAQVLQCLSAFSRRAHAIAPAKFPNPLGPKTISPQNTGSSAGSGAAGFKKPAPNKPPKPVSTWSRPEDETVTQPAWNIHQYGYMGGANQANMGINFGLRRGITTYADGPKVPTLAEKEARRKAEAEQQRHEAEQRERQREAELEAEEARAREEEERRWQEETRKLHDKERREAEQEKARWAAEQRAWEEEEERKRQQKQQDDVESRMGASRQHARQSSDARLNGQFLSQYRASNTSGSSPSRTFSESQRVKELEQELAEAKAREREYEESRRRMQESQDDGETNKSQPQSPPPPKLPARTTQHKPSYEIGSQEEERLALKGAWKSYGNVAEDADDKPPAMPPRPLPGQSPINHTSTSFTQTSNRTDRFLNETPAPETSRPNVYRPPEFSTDAEVDAENARRLASQEKTRASGWASKSILQREMENERARQQEWEEEQKKTREAVKKGVNTAGTGPGEGAWDVHQYGYLGGDSQNRGGPGLNFGGRRQIIGNPPPSS